MALQLPAWWKVAAFTFNLLCGLVLSQVLGAFLDKHVYKTVNEAVHILVMWALSFIMINVGYEFTVDKKDLAQYAWDYLIAMTAAGFPWLFVALWFMLLIDGMEADQAFLVARFAAPTSAGILFSMLEGAGLRDTWVFSKARILAIFDDLDTILLMIPLKIVMIGFKWELMVCVGIMVVLLAFAWRCLHRFSLPYSSAWSLVYAAAVTACCYGLYKVTKYHLPMEGIHIEVLLPAFVVGCVINTPCARHELKLQRQASLRRQESKQFKAFGLPDASGVPEADTQSREGAGGDEHPGAAGVGAVKVGLAQEEAEDVPLSPSRRRQARPREQNVAVRLGCVADEAAAVELGNGTRFQQAEDDVSVGKPQELVRERSWETSQSKNSRELVRERSWETSQSKTSQSKGSESSSVSRLSRHGHSKDESHPHESDLEHNVQTAISMIFMVLVGLSMPPLVGKNAKGDSNMAASSIAAHVLVVSLLMIIGKMFPVVCYRDEASWKDRLALCMGMCPRGEVGASIIVISLELGVEGPAVIISMCALVINLVLSGGFIGSVKLLLKKQVATAAVATAAGQNTAGPEAGSAGGSGAVALARDL